MLLGNFLIGLREGLEAALVVSILIAYLVKTGNRRALVPVWTGIAIAVALSFAFGIALSAASSEMQFKTQELFGGILSIIAVGLVTWMVFWMRRTARFMKAELEGKLEGALNVGPLALTAVAFLAVGREGLETALFLWTNISNSSGGSAQPITGALLGLAVAVVLGYLLYRGGLKIDLRRFFTWTGAALIVVAAGVFGYGFHDLQEAEVFPGLHSVALEPHLFFAEFGDAGDWMQTVFQGVLNVTPQITWLQLVMWAAYLVPVMFLFLRGPSASRPAATTAKPAAT
ncbi:iron uptake transporter permease EfeU [Actinomadura madurae]|uniref:iron uptake transporter permease EfeU n=1 Tax=Actinomadura madurae TaxID=1993 RepID=UPI002026864F|nr:iron uptake transporter permease EfeU [Actinomadura madurae]MCP9949062.1 FTR1 family protein [Actinomadura madurae]MCP9965825.1 FTR1 family protein [Actinomadura madurae]MCP9978304.1 FTR1 family protein [Actinomadura madurae]MCQ0010177.1 FTR1 family protein [Actinomadura madurae]MCQ0014511.1 FTR1 family protein [Actinomadura madurae]